VRPTRRWRPAASCRCAAGWPARCSGGKVALADFLADNDAAGADVLAEFLGQCAAGIARENVSRILNDWKRRKLVSRLSGYYCLENKALLQHEAEL